MNPILCPGENPKFLIFDFSTSPLLLFYTYIPAIVIALFLGFYVLHKDRSLAGKLLFLITFFFSLWVLDILVLWVSSYNDILFFGWQVTPIFEVLLFIFSAYFTIVMTNKERRDIHPILKLFFLFLIAVVFVLLPTHFNIMNYDIANCEGTPGSLFWYMYIGEVVTIFSLSVICLIRFFQAPKNDPFRKEIFYFSASIISFLVLFSGSNILGQITGIQEISFIGSLGMVIFLGCLVYLIVKFKEFNIKILATEALVWCLVVFIGSQFFFIKIPVYFVLNIVTFFAISIFGQFLIQSVRKEIEQREKIEKLAKDLENANVQLQQLDRQKDAVLHMVAHQFKGPVTTINYVTELLLDGTYGQLTDEQKENITSIRVASQNMGDQSQMVLAASQITLGKKLPIEPTPLDLNTFFKGVITGAAINAKQRKVELHVSVPSNLPTVMLDKKFTQIAVDNLLSNAIKYTALKWQEGGGNVDFSVIVKNKTLSCIVKDTGVGIPEKDKDKIFKELSRASNAGKEGTGLGLHVAMGAIESQGGKIWFESTEGKGTTFYCELPLKEAASK
jgi:signal transduction histidine kinase